LPGHFILLNPGLTRVGRPIPDGDRYRHAEAFKLSRHAGYGVVVMVNGGSGPILREIEDRVAACVRLGLARQGDSAVIIGSSDTAG
jgi:hypothetical protein